jgi:hypothetical protein
MKRTSGGQAVCVWIDRAIDDAKVNEKCKNTKALVTNGVNNGNNGGGMCSEDAPSV